MYKLYAQKRDGGYDKITQKQTIEEIDKAISRLKATEYYSYLIIQNNGEGDIPYDRQVLSEPVKIEFTDKDETSIEVKTHVFKPSKMKQKEELRRLTQDYIDR